MCKPHEPQWGNFQTQRLPSNLTANQKLTSLRGQKRFGTAYPTQYNQSSTNTTSHINITRILVRSWMKRMHPPWMARTQHGPRWQQSDASSDLSHYLFYFKYQLSPSTTQLQVLRSALRATTLVGKSRKNKNGEVISFRGILRETIASFHNQSNQ
jgi:hypothetical protein